MPSEKLSKESILNKYFRFTDNLLQGAFWLDEKGKILRANKRFALSLGYKEQEHVPQTIFEVNPNFSLISWRETWKKLLAEGEFQLNTSHINAEGLIHPVFIRGILFEQGEQKSCCAMIGRKQETERTRHLLELTASITHTGSWQYDLVKNSWVYTDEIFKMLSLEPGIRNKNLVEILSEVMSPDTHERFTKQFENCIETGKSFTLDFRISGLLENQYRYLRVTAVPEHNEEDTLSVYGLIQDISDIENNATEKYLTQHSVENAQEGMAWLNAEGTIVYANKAYKVLTGYKPNDEVSLNIYDVNPTLDQESWSFLWQEMKAKGDTVIETTHATKDGVHVPVEVYVNHLLYEGEEYLCTFLRDMRERQQKTQPQRLAQFTLEHNPMMVFWIEKSGQITYANKAATEYTGYSKEELTSMHIMELTDSYPDIKMWNARWRIMDKDTGTTYEGSITSKEKKKSPVELNRHYVKYEGREFICVFAKDITERKKEELKLRDNLEQSREQSSSLSKEIKVLRREMKENSGLNSIITDSDKYFHVLTQVRRVAETEATVLILGETGTGKELLAKAVHELSLRSDKPLIKVNAAVIPENLFESELFGHRKGSFTGAVQDREGRFEAADGGTIFLDEIGEMPLDLQAKLLRVLQEGEFERIGGNKTIKVDVRVIAATNRNLAEMVEKGKFREDLYYRLNVFPINNIPLRERKKDIPLLVDFFVKKYSRKIGRTIQKVNPDDIEQLMRYDFPGNVRELENMVERALILSNGKSLNLSTVLSAVPKKRKSKTNRLQTLDELQRSHIIETIKHCDGRISGKDGAAVILGLNDKTLYSRIKKLGIQKSEYIV